MGKEKILNNISNFTKLFNKEDFDYIDVIKSYNENSKVNFNNRHKIIGEFFECNLNVIAHSNRAINFIEKDELKKHNLVQHIILNNSTTFLYGAIDSLKKGFYTNSSILLRSYFESLIRVYYISYNQTGYTGVFGRSFKKKDDQLFNLKNFLEQKLKNGWEVIYEILSNECHSNTIKTIHDITEDYKSPKIQELNFTPLPYMEEFIHNMINIFTLSTLIFQRDIFLKDFKLNDNQIEKEMNNYRLIEKINSSIEILSEMLNITDNNNQNNHYLQIKELMKNITKLELGKQ